jgi:hypothetical protein
MDAPRALDRTLPIRLDSGIVKCYDQVILVRHVLTHRDYDQGSWKVRRDKPAAPDGKTSKSKDPRKKTP